MNMLNITKGVVLRPQKVVVYGPEGIGKSTFASHFPDPLFLDIEDSTSQLDVKRIPDINSWAMLHGIVEEIAKEKPCKTLVIDTVDWAEKLCIQYVCAQAKKSSIEDFAYGSGYTKLMEAFARFLEALNGVTRAGINVVLNAHAQIRKFEQPDEMGAYDRWELKLNSKTTNKTAAIVKEWADALLFANYKNIIMTDDKTGKKKGMGGKRVMYTQHASTWDAKNRWCLPPEVPFEYASIAPYIPTLGEQPVVIDSPQGNVPLPPDPSPEEEAFWDIQDNPAEADGPAPQQEVIATAAQVAAADPKQAVIKQVFDLLKTEGMTETDVRRAVAARGYYPEETSIMDYDIEFLKGVILGAWPQLKSFIVANKK
jgi:hypothetical protein